MRADARRNLDKIVEAAADVVADLGVDAPMVAIAKRAGVGVGTLYRRFPDRNALISAVGRHYMDSISQALARAAAGHTDAWSAIREFVSWVAESGRGALAAALAQLPDDALAESEEFVAEAHRWVHQLEDLVRRAQSDGVMRPDVRADDIMDLINVFTCHPEALPAPVAAKPLRYLNLMLDGMQTTAATPAGRSD
jgi:AcrR family transcriptional regulator